MIEKYKDYAKSLVNTMMFIDEHSGNAYKKLYEVLCDVLYGVHYAVKVPQFKFK